MSKLLRNPWSRSPAAPARPVPSVFELMRAASWRIGWLSVLSVGLVLTVGAALLLHLSTVRNLELQARSLAYSVEAAVVFQDRQATETLLQELLRHEPVSAARVRLGPMSLNAQPQRDGAAGIDPGEDFARYRKPEAEGGRAWLAEHLWPVRAEAPVLAQGRVQAVVELQADASALFSLVCWAAAGVLLAMGLVGVAVLRVSQRLADRLVLPLQALADYSRQMRQLREPQGQFLTPRSAPRAGVRELDQLSADFDALLQELSEHQQQLLREHDALRHAHAELSDQAARDGLTGVATRAHFERVLASTLSQASRAGGCFSLFFIDADHFKHINDQHGHEAGDCVLVAVAQRLSRSVRAQDLVGRLGGDEFVVLVHGLRQATNAPAIAEQLRHAVAQPVTLPNGADVVPGISVGLAIFPTHGLSAAELMKAADQDMYQRKRAARGVLPSGSSSRSSLEAAPTRPTPSPD